MESSPEEEQSIQQRKVEEFSDFVCHTLRPDSVRFHQAEQEVRKELADYTDLLQRLKNWPSSAVPNVDHDLLGHHTVYCPAVIPDTTRVVVNLGLRGNAASSPSYHQHHSYLAELTIPEARLFLTKRIELLSNHVLPHRVAKVKKVQAHIHAMEQMLDALSNELRKSS